MFDVNSNILRFKHEMKRPVDFFKVTSATFFIFGAICFGLSILSTIAYGNGIQAPVTDNIMSLNNLGITDLFSKSDHYLFFGSKVLIVIMMLSNFLLYQDTLFKSIEDFTKIIAPESDDS